MTKPTESKPPDLIQSRIASYLKGAWYARWGVIAVVGASFWSISSVEKPLVAVLIVAATIYNLMLLIGGRRHWSLGSNRTLVLTLDGAMALLLVMASGGINSAYLGVLAFMIISGAYWFGAWVGLSIGTAQTIVLYSQYLVKHETPLLPKGLLVRMLLLMTIGTYVAFLTNTDRLERQTLLNLETEMEKERQQLIAVIDNMQDAVLVVDNDDRIIISNHAALQYTSLTALVGETLGAALLFEAADGQKTKLKLKGADRLKPQDLQLRAPDKSLINVAANVAPYIVDRQNRGHVVIIRDVSQDKAIETEREEFMAVASHELRTPLTVAQGDISVLLAPPYLPHNKEAVHMLNGALRNLQQLSHIIKDLTNMSKIEGDKLNIELEPLNPVALLNEFKADYSDQAGAKGLELRLNIDPQLRSSTVMTSSYVVREILTAFMTNALKFTDSGAVTLGVSNPPDSKGVTFSVSDTGAGIAQSDQKKIFERFFQSETYATRKHGGTGLGLYIARRLAEQINSQIGFKSKLGEGSSFYLTVPIRN